MTAKQVQIELNKFRSPEDAAFLKRYFKTAPGQYGEGDHFIGLRVPQVRKIAKQYKNLSIDEIEALLDSSIHEHRLCALIIMTIQARAENTQTNASLYDLYLRRTDRINNWDLVDVSCRDIVGRYLMDKPREILMTLAKSHNVWERRIAIISTAEFMRHGQLDDTFALARFLINDTHDLIHKAVGWMLREAGKKNEEALKHFLDVYAQSMPRTMLRYSLERLSLADRTYYMKLKVK